MYICVSCEKNEGVHGTISGNMLCHKCTHELGLGHRHLPHIRHPLHYHNASPEELAAHLEKYPDEEAGPSLEEILEAEG